MSTLRGKNGAANVVLKITKRVKLYCKEVYAVSNM